MASFAQGALIERVDTVVTSGGTLALSKSSKTYQQLTGTSGHQVNMPDASTLKVGRHFRVSNRSSQQISVKAFDGTTLLKVLGPNSQALFVLISAPSPNGNWDVENVPATAETTPAWTMGTPAPIEAYSLGLELLDYSNLGGQEAWAAFKVAKNYNNGDQIKMEGGKFACSEVTGKVRFRARSYLLQAGTTVLDNYTNFRDSANAEVTVPALANQITDIGVMDLTDASGLINAVSVMANDIIVVRLIRDVATESVSAAADARLLRNSFTLVQS